MWILDLMKSCGVDVSPVVIDHSSKTGKAIIQVTGSDNAIILYPGTNHAITTLDLDRLFERVTSTDIILVQNELNLDATIYAIEKGYEKGCTVCFNPAPCTAHLHDSIPLDKVNILILNDIESNQICTGMGLPESEPSARLQYLLAQFEHIRIGIITLGKDGALCAYKNHGQVEMVHEKVQRKVNVVDTTGAGDTFIGFFLATLHASPNGMDLIQKALSVAVRASGLCCESKGAMSSIPSMEQVCKA
jgi:ribokinase